MLVVIARRLAATVPSLLGASVIVFLLLNVLPGDPLAAVVSPEATQAERDEVARRLGLTDPLPIRYGRWIANAARGDLGESLARRRPVAEVIGTAFANTLLLASAAALIGLTTGIVLGTLAALRAGGLVDRLVSVASVLGLSVPSYWLAVLLIIAFSASLRWLPAAGMYGSDENLPDLLRHLIMPALATSAVTIGLTARMTRASLIEMFSEDFVLALRAKGLSQRQILWHVTKNAAPPIMTVAGLQIAYLLSGSILVETIFSWPGMGQLIFQSIAARDLQVIQSSVLLIAVTFVVANLVIDVLQIVVNPRLRRAG